VRIKIERCMDVTTPRRRTQPFGVTSTARVIEDAFDGLDLLLTRRCRSWPPDR
jgi:hypothetical protein